MNRNRIRTDWRMAEFTFHLVFVVVIGVFLLAIFGG